MNTPWCTQLELFRDAERVANESRAADQTRCGDGGGGSSRRERLRALRATVAGERAAWGELQAQERTLRDACARGEREHAALVATQRQMVSASRLITVTLHTNPAHSLTRSPEHIWSTLKATFERDAEARQASTRALIRANLSMLTALSTDGPALDGAWRALREEGGGHRAAGGSFALRSLAQRRKGSTADELESFRTTPLDHSGLSLLRQIAQVGHAGLRWTLPRVGWAWWRAGGELPALLRANGAKARALARDDARLPALLAVAAAGERKVSLFYVGITVTFCTNPANNLTSPLIYYLNSVKGLGGGHCSRPLRRARAHGGGANSHLCTVLPRRERRERRARRCVQRAAGFASCCACGVAGAAGAALHGTPRGAARATCKHAPCSP